MIGIPFHALFQFFLEQGVNFGSEVNLLDGCQLKTSNPCPKLPFHGSPKELNPILIRGVRSIVEVGDAFCLKIIGDPS